MNNPLNNLTLLTDTFKSISETVLINGKPQQAVITFSGLGEQEKRIINSLEPFEQGDLVEHEGQMYLVSEEVTTPRGIKYRATMTLCNYTFVIETKGALTRVQIDTDTLGKPIYKDVYAPSTFDDVPAIIYGFQSKYTYGQIATSISTMFIHVQHNDKNMTDFSTNKEIPFRDKAVKLKGRDISRNGLLGIEAEVL